MTGFPLRPSGRPLDPLRRWIDRIGPRDVGLARLLVRLIPGQCPFERSVVLFGRRILRIPPLCHLNPLYDELMALRLRSLSLLAELEERPQREAAAPPVRRPSPG